MIIGTGFKARSGKDTVASYLINKYGFVQESFASPLKEELGRNICGLNDKQLYGTWKETYIPEYEMTARELLQKMGDAMRSVHPSFWILPMKRRIKEHKNKGNNLIVVSDCRYLNEAEMVKSFSGIMIQTNRKNADIITNSKHISEVELSTYDKWDHILDNNGTIEELYKQIDTIMSSKLYHILG